MGNVLDVGNTTGAANKIPATGAGTRFMWFAARGSLRFGRVTLDNPTSWNDANMDDFTFAGGNDVTASDYGAFAYGDQVHVSSTVGVGFGSNIKVTGVAGFACGASNVVGGFAGVALGYTDSAMGQGSVALGYRVNAREDYSVALGYRARAYHEGSMILSDASVIGSDPSAYTFSSADNQFTSRYAGGYRLYTNSAKTIGVSLFASDNSWNIISDSTKKERYLPADADEMLSKIKNMRLGSWNYKEYKDRRHYGPMAQEFHANFGTDAYGNFGNDTTISQADMEGVMMIMLQALEKRTAMQQDENSALKTKMEEMAVTVQTISNENAALKEQLAFAKNFENQILIMQQQLNDLKGVSVFKKAKNN
ncbi:MAG: tail fiber domain-containing protein [Bacteroidota bacterium]